MVQLRPHLLAVICLFCLAGLGVTPLLHPGLYTAHDIWHQVARLYHYSSLVSLGAMPPLLVFNFSQGYGYPLFFFSYHFPWFFGSALVGLGFSVTTSLKLLFAGSYLAASCNMYWLVFRLTKNKFSSTLAAAVYLWSPYFFLTLYVAATMGTAFLFALLPLLVIGLQYLTQKDYLRGCLLLGSSLAAAVLTHVLSVTLLLPLLGGIWFFGYCTTSERRKYFIWSAGAGVLALGLSAFYVLPLHAYFPLIAASTNSGGLTDNYARYFVTLKQLVYSPWGFSPIISDAKQGDISFQIGIAQWLGGIFSFGLLGLHIFLRKNKLFTTNFATKNLQLIVVYIGLLLVSVLLMLDISQPFWLVWTKVFTLDFPFRLLLMSVFTGSVLVGLSLASVKKTWLRFVLGASFLLVALYTNRNHVRVNLYTNVPLDLYIASETTTNTYHEYLPLSGDTNVLNHDVPSLIPEMPSWVLQEQRSPIEVRATIETPIAISAAIRQFAFPGVVARVNGVIANERIDDKGKLVVHFPAGKSQVTLRYEKPLLVRVSEYISIASLTILLLLLGLRKKMP